MVGEKFASAKGRSRGSGGMPPRKVWFLKALKGNFQHSQADSYIKKVPKIGRYFLLNFDKKSVVISCSIFSDLIIIVTPLLMLAKYDTSFLRRTKSAHCSLIFCSFTLREFLCNSLGKRLVISVSQRQGVNGSANSQQNVWFGNYCWKARKPSDRTGQSCCVISYCSSCVIHQIHLNIQVKRFVHLITNIMII